MINKIRLLIVDDERSVLRTLRRMAELVGFEAYGVLSASEAMKWLSDQSVDVVVADASPPRVDAVITDINMPGMDGCTLGREIVRLWPEIRMLFISGYIHSELVALGICQEDIPLLLKPFTPRVFVDTINNVMNQPPWLPQRRMP